MKISNLIVGTLLMAITGAATAFDQSHSPWSTLLRRHVQLAPDGHASRVDYRGFSSDAGALNAYLDTLSSVPEAEYRSWTKNQRLAFLINAYNAFTIKLVLTRYPDLKSIKDLGSLLSSPWKRKFFSLLGTARSLDDVEHGLIRAPGSFDEPRIHFAVNCASIGCPLLQPEAFVAERLEAQLEDSTRRFLADRSRNRYDAATGRLQVSRIFDWYGADFEKGWRGIKSMLQFFATHADLLADSPSARERVRQGQGPVHFLEYDWNLNDSGR
jgi:hypothetical protein